MGGQKATGAKHLNTIAKALGFGFCAVLMAACSSSGGDETNSAVSASGGGNSGGGGTMMLPESRLSASSFRSTLRSIENRPTGGITYDYPVGAASYRGNTYLEIGPQIDAVGRMTMTADFTNGTFSGSADDFVFMGTDNIPADGTGGYTMSGTVAAGAFCCTTSSGSFSGRVSGLVNGNVETFDISGTVSGGFKNASMNPFTNETTAPEDADGDLTGTAVNASNAQILVIDGGFVARQ